MESGGRGGADNQFSRLKPTWAAGLPSASTRERTRRSCLIDSPASRFAALSARAFADNDKWRPVGGMGLKALALLNQREHGAP